MNPFKPRPGITLVEIKGVTFLAADKEARKSCPYIRELNEIGAFIWKKLEEDTDIDLIKSALRSEYDIPENYDLRSDIDTFLKELESNNYIVCVNEKEDDANEV